MRAAQMAFEVVPCALKHLPKKQQKRLTLIIQIILSKMYLCVTFEVLAVIQIR